MTASGPDTTGLTDAAGMPATAGMAEMAVAPESEVPPIEQTVGRRIRQFRGEAGLSLRALSALTSLSIGFLSQVERGLCSISLTALRDVAHSLGRDMSEFFSGDGDGQSPPAAPRTVFTITRAAEQDALDTYVSGQRAYQMLSGRSPGLVLEPLLVHIAPGGDLEEAYGHEGEEFAYVLTGELLYIVDGAEYRLGPGDSVHLRSDVPHQIHNDTDSVTTVVSVITPRLF